MLEATFIDIPTRVTSHSKRLTDNIFYNKPMLNITAGNISSIISDHLIQFLIEPSATNAKLEQTRKLQRCHKNLIRQNKDDLHKISWKEHCSNPDSNVALEHFLRRVNNLPNKLIRYC